MNWEVKEVITEEDLQKGLRGVTLDGLATKMTLSLTTGAFLVALALQFGASNSVIGLLAAIPMLTNILQIPAVYLVEQMRVRRAISVYFALAGRSTLLVIALIPFLFPADWAIAALVIGLLLKGAFGAVSQCAWSSWMRDLVPREKRGSFYAKRMSLAAIVGMVVSLVAGYYLDWFKAGFPHYILYSYTPLFLLAFLAGMANVWFIANIPEPRMKSKGVNIFGLMLEPFKNENFSKLMKFLVTWNFAINLAAPFFTVYMLKSIKLDMSTVVALTVLSQAVNIAALRIWGRFMDQFTNKSVLNVCGPLFIVSIFFWIFAMHPDRHALTIPLLIFLHIAMGIATAGTVLGTSNIAIKLAPKDAATSYLATSSVANSISAGIAPIVGGLFADFFAQRKLSLLINWTSPGTEVTVHAFKLTHWDFFFFFAFVIGLFSIRMLGKVQEKGEVDRQIIIHEFLSEIGRSAKSLSTVGGLLQTSQFPLLFRKNSGNEKKGDDKHS
jgi:MFS family permease